MDTDSILYRNLDPLFLQSGTWSQRNNFYCTDSKTVHGFVSTACSGLLVVEPDSETYDKLLQYSIEHPDLPYGDQQLIQLYFGSSLQHLSHRTANFGQCINKRFHAVDIGIPDFVHK